MTRVSRGGFLRSTTAAGAALALGASLDGCAKSEGPGAGPAGKALAPNVWVRIAPDDTYTFTLAKSEMGQGIETGLTTVVAEELDVPFERMTVEFALAKPAYKDIVFGDMTTGGSTSTADSWTPLRIAGATARAMLVLAGAKRWNVEAASCTTHAGTVVHAGSKRTATYGELASDAAALDVPSASRSKRRRISR